MRRERKSKRTRKRHRNPLALFLDLPVRPEGKSWVVVIPKKWLDYHRIKFKKGDRLFAELNTDILILNPVKAFKETQRIERELKRVRERARARFIRKLKRGRR